MKTKCPIDMDQIRNLLKMKEYLQIDKYAQMMEGALEDILNKTLGNLFSGLNLGFDLDIGAIKDSIDNVEKEMRGAIDKIQKLISDPRELLDPEALLKMLKIKALRPLNKLEWLKKAQDYVENITETFRACDNVFKEIGVKTNFSDHLEASIKTARELGFEDPIVFADRTRGSDEQASFRVMSYLIGSTPDETSFIS